MAFSRRSNEHTAGEKILIAFCILYFGLFCFGKSSLDNTWIISGHKVPVMMNQGRVCDRFVRMNV